MTCGVWVGFDSRESLGDKETGAKAALPIWMTLMRAAIAGKDNEKFLGDEADDAAPKAAADAAAKTASPVKAGVAGGPVKASAAAKPNSVAAVNSAAGKAPAQTTAKPAAQLQSAAGTKLLVKPALTVQPDLPRPAGAVKPALSSGGNPAR